MLVTGSRGKSSVVRLLTASLARLGLEARGRITGVAPRELRQGDAAYAPLKEVVLMRSGPASVGEMRWWLSTLRGEVDAVVMENSAVAPELQGLAFRWLDPVCSVLVNVRPDHEDAWGSGEENAARALCQGLGGGHRSNLHPVVVPAVTAGKPFVGRLLAERGCRVLECPSFADFREEHVSIASEVLRLLGLDPGAAREAVLRLPPDIADFAVLGEGEGLIASAFSANDPETTEQLFLSTGWRREETSILFNGRADRPARLRAFLPWITSHPWRRACIIGGRSLFPPRGMSRLALRDGRDLARFISAEGRVLGCGNVAGAPLDYLERRAGREGGANAG